MVISSIFSVFMTTTVIENKLENSVLKLAENLVAIVKSSSGDVRKLQ